MNNRRKFKTTKAWPGGPEVGTIFSEEKCDKFYADGFYGYLFSGQLEGFVEEIKEPEEFWCVTMDGNVNHKSELCMNKDLVSNFVAKEFRFPTKEHAQAFADFMKNSLGDNIRIEKLIKGIYLDINNNASQALNSRRHD